MMIVPNYLDRSKIHGFGVFAKENIKAGTPMWEYLDGYDLDLIFDDFPLQVRQYIKHYGNMVRPGVYLLCGDNARFMNHSEAPNMSASGAKNIALRDISAGEEITCNYSEFDITFIDFKKHDSTID
jgi:hypothetical protein